MQLAIYMLQVTGCLAIFYGFYHLLLQRETTFRFNRIYLLTTLFLSMILPLVKIYIDAQQVASVMVPPQLFMHSYINTIETVTVESPSANSFPWKYLLLSLYSGGMLFMSFRLIRDLFRIREIAKNGNQTIINDFTCIQSSQVQTPFSFFNRVFLPANHGFSQEELSKIMNHETAHIKGAHTIDVLGLEIVSVFLWCSPMIYLYKRKLREVHEYLADAAVTTTDHWEHYAQLLVAQKKYGLQNSLSNHLVYSQLKNRLVMMTKKPSSTWSALRYMGFLPVLIIAIVIFSFREKAEKGSIGEARMQNNFGTVLFEADTVKEGSVRVMSNGNMLKEREDYIIDFASGFIKIINPAYLGPGISINVSFDSTIQDKADTMPTTYIRALKLTEPAQEDRRNENTTAHDTYEMAFPVFPGCDELPISERGMCGMTKMTDYINKHMVYPESLKKAGIEGQVIINFMVGIDGYVKEVKIEKSLHPDADQAALQVFRTMNSEAGRWRPSRKEGKTMEAEISLPITFALSNKANESKSGEEPYTFVEQMPNFPCELLPVEERGEKCSTTALFNFIHSAIKYPKKDREQGNEGTVIVRFIVEADGTVSNVHVVRGVSPGLNDEAMRVVQSMNDLPYRWTPGMHNGNAVRVQFTLPFKFALQSENMGKIKSGELPDYWGEIQPKDAQNPVENSWIKINPNPAGDMVEIEILENVESITIAGFSKVIMWQKENVDKQNKYSINVSNWIPGKYIIYLYKDGVSKNAGFIVQH